MTLPPILFDSALLDKRRFRAVRHIGRASHLHARWAQDMLDSFGAIVRPFSHGAILGALGHQLPNQLKDFDSTKQIDWRLFDRIGFVGPMGPVMPTNFSAETSPIEKGQFDLVLSPFVLHWVNDIIGVLSLIRANMVPDGLFLGALFGGETLRELRHVLLQAESEAYGGAGMRISPFARLDNMSAVMGRAGFALPVVDIDHVTVRYKNMFALLRDLRAMGESAAFTQRPERPLTRAIIARAADLYQAQFSDDDGKIRASFDIISLSGWAPAESQPKPAPRGSGKTSLEAALKEIAKKRGDETPKN